MADERLPAGYIPEKAAALISLGRVGLLFSQPVC